MTSILIFVGALAGIVFVFFSQIPRLKKNNRTSIIEDIASSMREHQITLQEIESVLANIDIPLEQIKESQHDIMKKLFSYLGGVFIFAGITAYIYLFWDSMGSTMRIFVTLGVGIMLQTTLLVALKEQKFPKLILPLIIAAIVIQTTGWFVAIHELFPQGGDARKAASAVFLIMALQQFMIFRYYFLTSILLFALLFTYGFLQVSLELIGVEPKYIALILGSSLFFVADGIEKTSYHKLSQLGFLAGAIWFNAGLFDLIADYTDPNWAGVIVGITGSLTAFGLSKTHSYPRLVELGYLLGSIIFFAGLFEIMKHKPFELLYLVVTSSVLYLCTIFKSRVLLLTSVIAMLSFIGYYTTEYFVGSIGWPIALILMGVAFFGISTLALRIKRSM